MGKIAEALDSNMPKEQLEAVKPIVDLIQERYTVIIEDSNDLQAGMINSTFDTTSTSNIPNINFLKCGAMSKGYIGHHLQIKLIRKKLIKIQLKLLINFLLKKMIKLLN